MQREDVVRWLGRDWQFRTDTLNICLPCAEVCQRLPQEGGGKGKRAECSEQLVCEGLGIISVLCHQLRWYFLAGLFFSQVQA